MDKATHSAPGHTRMMQECIDACQRCHAVCTQTAQHCLGMGGDHAQPSHIALLLDCAEICQSSADFMLRGSDRHQLTCGLCAEVCRACAEECARMSDGDAMMDTCAETCRRCADSCEQMASGN